jgi:hypothetical protein
VGPFYQTGDVGHDEAALCGVESVASAVFEMARRTDNTASARSGSTNQALIENQSMRGR